MVQIAPYVERLDEAGQFLTLAVRAQRSPAESEELRARFQRLGATRAGQFAARNDVEFLVLAALKNTLSTDALPATVHERLAANGRRVAVLVEALAQAAERLDAIGCRTAAIEGGGVLLDSGLSRSAFCPSDIDVLVEPDRWGPACGAARAMGFSRSADVPARPDRVRLERTVSDAAGGSQRVCIELCSDPFTRDWLPHGFSDRRAAWLERRIPCSSAPGIHVLQAEDALALVLAHTSLHAFVRSPGLRLHVDADRLISDKPIDWDVVVEEVGKLGARRRAFVSLAIANALLNTQVPDGVLAELCPSNTRWRAIRALLAGPGVLASERPKLARLQTLLVEMLVDDRRAHEWLSSALFPPEAWMRAHFDAGESPPSSHWRLQWKRHTLLINRWRPR